MELFCAEIHSFPNFGDSLGEPCYQISVFYKLQSMANGNIPKGGNIVPMAPGNLMWQSDNASKSIEQILKHVEIQASEAMAWYWRKKRWKAMVSIFIQFSAVVLTALGGLVPVAVRILAVQVQVDTGLWTSLFVGLAAALIGIDRAFGYSSGWARYVLTATSIRKSLEEFRMDWTALLAKSGSSPNPDQIAALIQRAKDFIVGVESMVLQETKDWVTEFQYSIAQLDKEARAQFDSLKAQVEKAEQTRAAATQPGSIELTVPNADKADGFTFDASMEGSQGKLAEERISNTKKWVRINVPPGHYRVLISTMVNGKPTSAATAILVKPQEVTRFEVPLL